MYAAPTRAAGSDPVLMDSEGVFGAIAMLSAALADAAAASVTWTVKLAVPAAVGVPAICDPFKLSPAGSEPDETAHA